MREERVKTEIAEKVVRLAKNKAYKSVGRSFPCGMHEVEIPEKLMKLVEKHEED